jgi:hypothetical protein
VLERLTALLTGPERPVNAADRDEAPCHGLRPLLESTANEVSTLSDVPGPIRGDTRARVSARLAELDAAMLRAARAQADAATLQALRQEAADQLAPFRERMTNDVYDAAIDSAVDRLLRDREQLPVIAFD